MAAAVYTGPGEIVVEERPLPEIGARDVLVEVGHCGICGTDLHLVLEGMGHPGSIGGHEWSGRIVALGSDVTGWSVGEMVVAGPLPGCGECVPCRRGRPSVCTRLPAIDFHAFQGAFAHYVRTDAARLHPVPEGLSPRLAALTEPLAVALHALTVSGVRPGQRVLVTGAGPVGLLTLAALRATGVDDVTVSEPAALRRERALALGARRAIEPGELPVPGIATPVGEPFDVAFECSGRGEACEAALDQLGFAATLVLVGTGRRRPTLNHNRAILLELTITGAFNYDADGFERALGLLASRRLPSDLLVNPVDVALPEMLDAMRGLAAGRVAAKVLVDPWRDVG
jgi:2-desacetyl-2-hydroxyethyl bacteriochlorophyllide A dehydrogenase